VTTLGFEDGTCDRVDDALGARRIRTIIDAVEPDAVLTFGPDGVTGHADHRAVGRWTASALASRRRQVPLLTAATQMAWPGDLIERMHRVDAFYPGHPRVTPGGPVHRVRVVGPLLEAKLAALGAHGSQVGPLQSALGADGYRRLAAADAYCAANPAAVARLGGAAMHTSRAA
jgi:LmbE family N-acetylglucosaminyl deacetylase